MSYNMVNRGGHIGEAKRDLDELEKRTSSP